MSKVPPRSSPPKKLKSVSKKKYKPKYYGSQQLKKTPAWRIFSEYIRRRGKGTCYTCPAKGHWKGFHAGHYISANVCGKSLFFGEQTTQSQCPRCNLFLHGAGADYALRLRKDYGEGILEQIDQIRREEKEKGIICRFSKEELSEIAEKYQKKLDNKCKFCDELLVDYQEHECS